MSASTEIAEEAVGAFASLYPKISLPYDVWQTLIEIIDVEIRSYYGEGHPDGLKAIVESDLYITAAERSGLR